MTGRRTNVTWSSALDRVTFFLAWIAGLCLMVIMVVIASGVVMRYAVRAPILGVNEIVQLTAVALVMAALPYCTMRNAHVGVDVFDAAIGRWGRLVGDVLSRLLSGFTLLVLCCRAALKALDAFEWGDATNMLGLPIWPFYGMLAAGTGLCVLIFAMQLAVILSKGPQE